jgi:hypothetical protein
MDIPQDGEVNVHRTSRVLFESIIQTIPIVVNNFKWERRQKTDEIEALKKLCDLLKQLGVSKCAAKTRSDQAQTSEITITEERDVAFIFGQYPAVSDCKN